MKTLLRCTFIALLAASLSGCIALAAGAAGGYYVAKNYDITRKQG